MNLKKEITTAFIKAFRQCTSLDINEQLFQVTATSPTSATLLLGFPIESIKPAIVDTMQQCLTTIYPHPIHIEINQFIKAHRTQLTGKGLRNVKNVIAIASGKGGVGKSTITVNLATALAKAGAQVGILDADIYGPSIPLMLGKTKPVEIENDAYLPVEAHGIQAMSIGYLTEGEPALIWRGPMLAKALLQMLDITQWDNLDYLLIDLPPGTGDIQLSLVQKIPLAGAVIVTTPQTVATLDAQKALKMFSKTNIDVIGIIENMSTHICNQCGHQEAIFGKGGAMQLCQDNNIALLGQMPLQAEIVKQSDEGFPSAIYGSTELSQYWQKTAFITAMELAKKPLNYADKFPPIVVE